MSARSAKSGEILIESLDGGLACYLYMFMGVLRLCIATSCMATVAFGGGFSCGLLLFLPAVYLLLCIFFDTFEFCIQWFPMVGVGTSMYYMCCVYQYAQHTYTLTRRRHVHTDTHNTHTHYNTHKRTYTHPHTHTAHTRGKGCKTPRTTSSPITNVAADCNHKQEMLLDPCSQ